MNQRGKDRAARLMLAALLDSDLTIAEIRDTLSMLDMEGSRALRETFDAIFVSRAHFSDAAIKRSPRTISQILNAAAKLRLSKRELLTIMTEAGAGDMEVNSKGSVREMIVEFLKKSSAAQQSLLLRHLGIYDDPDPYLEGILQKR